MQTTAAMIGAFAIGVVAVAAAGPDEVETSTSQPIPVTASTASPTSEVPTRPAPEVVMLTTSGEDGVDVAVEDESVKVTALESNTTKGQRHLAVPSTDPIAGGEFCASVDGSTETTAQPGLALIDGDRAITLTNNIWGRDRAQWNIHGWHRDAAGDWGEPAQLHGVRLDGFEEAVRPDMPWTMCVSAVGSTVSFSARPAGQPDPDGSPDATRWMAGPLEVPTEFAVDQSRSRGGYFAGHLQAGETLTFAAWPSPAR